MIRIDEKIVPVPVVVVKEVEVTKLVPFEPTPPVRWLIERQKCSAEN